jgi:NADH-dependent peroxiredoxin subunit F
VIYDLIIVGAGPAGITASVYAARKKMNFLVITDNVGGQAALSAHKEEYTGYQFITAAELVRKFREHVGQPAAAVEEGVTVKSVVAEGGSVKVYTDGGTYESRTAIIATGRVPKKLGAEGEDEFKYKGVTYCSTCDGPLFANRDVAVVGGGNSALYTVLQMEKIAKKVYLVHSGEKTSADPVMVEKARNSGKVSIYGGAAVEKIFGEKFVKGIRISRGGKSEDITVQGVFIEMGSVPAAGFIGGAEKNAAGEIVVNNNSETSVPGIFAAGDVTSVPAKQIIVACGEGAKAALAAFKYISQKKGA